MCAGRVNPFDGGNQWSRYKGGDFPAVAVRDIAIQPRDNDLVIATHGRGIWIIDDITPLRALTPSTLAQDVVFMRARPTIQKTPGQESTLRLFHVQQIQASGSPATH